MTAAPTLAASQLRSAEPAFMLPPETPDYTALLGTLPSLPAQAATAMPFAQFVTKSWLASS